MSQVVPVVLLHGLRTSSTMWRAQLEALRASGERAVVAPDLPGHGTRTAERFTLEAALGTVDDAVHAVGGRAVVVGLSLGGYLALAWAARHPHDAIGVVAAGCTARPGGPLTRGWTLASRLIARLPDRGAWLNARTVAAAIPEPGATDLGAGGFALDVMVDALREVSRLDTRADLAAVQAPLWLVNGRWDHFRIGERGALRAAPGARLVVVPGSTHLVSVVAPVAFSRVLLGALDELDAREAVSSR
ncbi:alpha/beta hydrolase [Actinotalea sp. M2MS4P-6]|uniref:alpha/beta fold hydrolase n=1 Tax=Actinotalea sp. M2MS4P-6 TaxID=2983762 RepID=UPI0021E438EB|nr:alpha/beta hydrolase [Actinotalea sp. M2MS4P-6]MCV2395539.1 alpha/beta hydrolase [Actinotalea sp. M2MS4P-6]